MDCADSEKVSQDSQYGQPQDSIDRLLPKSSGFFSLSGEVFSLSPSDSETLNPMVEGATCESPESQLPKGLCLLGRQAAKRNEPASSLELKHFQPMRLLHFDEAHGGFWDLSSMTRHQTCTPCIGRQIPNHWTAKEVPRPIYFQSSPGYL